MVSGTGTAATAGYDGALAAAWVTYDTGVQSVLATWQSAVDAADATFNAAIDAAMSAWTGTEAPAWDAYEDALAADPENTPVISRESGPGAGGAPTATPPTSEVGSGAPMANPTRSEGPAAAMLLAQAGQPPAAAAPSQGGAPQAAQPEAAKPTGTNQPNKRQFGASRAGTGLKKALQNKYGVPTVTELPKRDYAKTNGTTQGNGTHYKSIPDGFMVGTSGAGPCIGVIIVGPPDRAGNREIWVYHFQSGDNVSGTLNRDGPFPKGSKAVIFGGQNGVRESMGSLNDVESSLRGCNVTIDGVYNSPGLWVDRNGNYFVHSAERRTTEKDGTQPTPPP